LEQVFNTSQAEEENEHSEEWLNTFSQEVEKKEVVALKLTAEEEVEEQVDRFLTPWEMELEILEDWLNNLEPAGDCHEQILAEEHSVESLKFFSQGAKREMKTVELNFAAGWQVKATEEGEEDGKGDHSDLPNCKKKL
jgi:hypothetical protein